MSSKPLPMRPDIMVDKQKFRRACGRFATGVAIATVLGVDAVPHGMTINSFTSVSLTPPLVLFCVDHEASILKYFRNCEYFGINFLKENQQNLSRHFARKGQDRFGSIEWHAGTTGVPLIPGTLGHLECALTRVITAGDHDILIGEVVDIGSREGRPLLYFESDYHRIED